MIKFIYEQPNYYYDGIGGQRYDMKLEIKMVDDASFGDVLDAVMRLGKAAGYIVDKRNVLNAIEDIFEDRDRY